MLSLRRKKKQKNLIIYGWNVWILCTFFFNWEKPKKWFLRKTNKEFTEKKAMFEITRWFFSFLIFNRFNYIFFFFAFNFFQRRWNVGLSGTFFFILAKCCLRHLWKKVSFNKVSSLTRWPEKVKTVNVMNLN